MSLRTAFLILVASVQFNIRFWPTIFSLVGYSICAEIDKWQASKAKIKAIDTQYGDEMDYWKPHPEKPGWEEKGDWDRIKLPHTEQIVVTRVAQVVRRMMLAW